MRATIRTVVAALSLICPPALMATAPVGVAMAQQADQEVKQMALTEKQIQSVIAAKPEIEAIIAKLPEGNDKPDPKVLAQLDAAAKKQGFANYAEFEAVDDNISLVMAGIDSDTKKYVGDEAVLKKEIAGVQADKQMSAKDKKEALDQLNAAMKAVKPLQFQANIALVLKYYDKLSAEEPSPKQ
jgi:hypothetical protein